MTFSPNILVAIAAACVGFTAFWANPRRRVNRFFFSGSLHAAAWLMAGNMASVSDDAIFWIGVASSIGAFLPLHLWLLKEGVVFPNERFGATIRRGWCWLALGLFFGVVPFTAIFIPAYSTPENPVFGWGYYGYTAGLLVAYLALLRQAVLQMRAQTGAARLELQVLLLGASAAAGCILLIMVVRAIWGDRWILRFRPQSFVVLFFYTLTAAAITTHRIFDARQILFVALRKFMLVGLVAAAAAGTFLVLEDMMPIAVNALVTTGVALWLATISSEHLDRLFEFYPAGTNARQAAYSAAQRENRIDNLEKSFLSVLRGWGQSEVAVIMSGTKDALAGQNLRAGGAPVDALRELRWATPERLTRERNTPKREALKEFLSETRLGVATIVDGPSLTLVLGVGYGAARRPFTYPQVTQLMELASIMESALERAHFSAKVQHTEQLATVGLLGASLAHEIRNPLVSIKTFVQLLPAHHHDPRFREKFFKLIGDEVGRIDQLTEQLLDLASPRTYEAKMIELHPLLRASIDLVAAKAAHRDVQLLTEFSAAPDTAFTDASAAKQVMLNLCFNAIQAVENIGAGTRWVKIATRNTKAGIEMAVADNGPGISPEIRPKLFQPFQTTKSTGFGLGLAICSDILANLNASISVDPPTPGCGATFRVTFPCQPSSS